MYFQQRSDFGQTVTAVQNITTTTGQQEFRIPLQRTFPIEAIQIQVEMNVSGVAATLNVDGLQNILKRVNLTIADGVRTRTVVDCSGPDLLEFQVQTRGFIDADTTAALGGQLVNSANAVAVYGNNTTGIKRLTYLIDCAPTQIMDPLSSMMLLPVTRYPSDPILALTIAGANDIDKNAAITFAATNIVVTVSVYRRFVNVDQWAYIDWDLTTQDTPLPSAVSDFRIELLTPGSYFGTLYKCYAATSGAGIPLVRYDITNPQSPGIRIESLNVNFRRFTFRMLKALNEASRGYAFLPGSAIQFFPASFYSDFLTDRLTDATELGSVLDANIPVNSGATVNLMLAPSSTAGGVPTVVQSGSFLRQLHWRAYGNLSSLKGVR